MASTVAEDWDINSSSESEETVSTSCDAEHEVTRRDALEKIGKANITTIDQGISDNYLSSHHYRKIERKVETWLATNPGGTASLYPELLVIRPCEGGVTTPAEDKSQPRQFLGLPREIRDWIYRAYFDCHDPEDEFEGFKSGAVRAAGADGLPFITVGRDNLLLKYWLRLPLLKISRQFRHEALPVFLQNFVFIVHWLPDLPRFADFLGPLARSMVRHMDVWDNFDMQRLQTPGYLKLLSSLRAFQRLHDLNLILCRGANFSDWFDAHELHPRGRNKGYPRSGFLPKMRLDSAGVWPEQSILQDLCIKEFTLLRGSTSGETKFDMSHGALPVLVNAMRANWELVNCSKDKGAGWSRQSQQDHMMVAADVNDKARDRHLQPNAILDRTEEEATTMNVAIYNYIREVAPLLTEPHGAFSCIPTAERSEGHIIHNCALCYLIDDHCGYHGLPCRQTDDVEVRHLATLSLDEFRQALRKEIHEQNLLYDEGVGQVVHLQKNLGWPDTPKMDLLNALHQTSDSEMESEEYEEEELRIWNVMCSELQMVFDPPSARQVASK